MIPIVKSLRNTYSNICKAVENLYTWWQTIITDRDYDYEYLWIIEQKKLQQMKKYFENTKLIDSAHILKYINICIKLLDVLTGKVDYLQQTSTKSRFLNTNIETYDYSFNHYVNKRNIHRFKDAQLEHQLMRPEVAPFVLDDLYKDKALFLYYKILYEQIRRWWD